MHHKIDIKNRPPELVLESLMEEYMGFVYSIIYKKINTVATNEDIEETVSDVFVRLYNSLWRYDSSKGSLKGFIAKIATNTAIDKYRQLINTVNSISAEDLLTELVDETSDVDEQYIRKEQQKKVFDAILGLKEPNRTIVFRRFYLNETITQISCTIGYSQNATEKRLKRTLNKLEKSLEGII